MEKLSSTGPFQFDVEEALKTGFYASGTTGCGKTTLAKRCKAALQVNGVTTFTFDVSQAWLTNPEPDYIVRFRENLSPASIEAGLQGIELRDCVFDVSSLTTLQFQEVADKFSWMLFNLQAKISPLLRKQMFVIFEEAHIVFPQGVMGAKRLQNVVRLISVGRNFKIRVGMITQFASMLDKSILRYAGQRYFGWTDEYNDCRRIGTYIGEETANSLRYFKSGEFIYYCPSQLIQEKIYVDLL